MVDNFSNHVGLGDEGKDAKFSATFTKEGVGLKDPLDQILPIVF